MIDVMRELLAADIAYDRARDALARDKRAGGNWRQNPLSHLHPSVVAVRDAAARRSAAIQAAVIALSPKNAPHKPRSEAESA